MGITDILSYPGQYVYWQILWIQIILLVFVQFTTALSLYEQRHSYARFLTVPLERVLPWKGRDLLVKVHAASGISVLVLNLLCTVTWFYFKLSGGVGFQQILFGGSESTLIAWINISVSTLVFLMFVFGVSLYKNNRPDTSLPFWKLEYFLSRTIHRIVFFLLVVVLGYHIFFIPKISRVWVEWLFYGHGFSVVLLAVFVIGGMASAQAVLMVVELVTGTAFTKESQSPIPGISLIIACIVVIYSITAYLLYPPDQVTLGMSLFLLSATVSTFAKFVLPRIKQKQPVIVTRRIQERDVTPLLSEVVRKFFRDLNSLSKELVTRSILEVIDYTYTSWKNKLDWRSESDYCGSLFLHTILELTDCRKVLSVEEANELSDAGKLLSLLTWTKLNDFEMILETEDEIEKAFTDFRMQLCRSVLKNLVERETAEVTE